MDYYRATYLLHDDPPRSFVDDPNQSWANDESHDKEERFSSSVSLVLVRYSSDLG